MGGCLSFVNSGGSGMLPLENSAAGSRSHCCIPSRMRHRYGFHAASMLGKRSEGSRVKRVKQKSEIIPARFFRRSGLRGKGWIIGDPAGFAIAKVRRRIIRKSGLGTRVPARWSCLQGKNAEAKAGRPRLAPFGRGAHEEALRRNSRHPCREQTPFLDWRPAPVHDKLGMSEANEAAPCQT
jgi:hypothetical protein